ncbi:MULTISPECIES: MptD family putative ECF transporter S component [Staphylococcus]|nr:MULTISPECIES: MptD family putative ECF transporter S component [Staphylococcus]MBE7576246.1 MptD family putative ECF transporter S component [Staphylococcus aureus]HDJ5153400.1 MptD family putative ECF transporter S component [Staphylococcus aureus]HDJ5199598.1 MptD family putative ECF transporter S component [Staphylococcus aureus]HDJ5231868.1 MptD family putative ECF transporter S component [Staphylococcus aureus]HDJ5378258.1 MptD family putative ECF transporter S component [Staphylococcu
MKKKMNTKDYIFAGAFAAIYIVILVATGMLFGLNPVTFLLTPLITGIILGPVFILYISKVPKRGAVFILAILSGLTLSSTTIAPLFIAIVAGILAEVVLNDRSKYTKLKNIVAYSIFNIIVVGPFTMLIFARDQFMKSSEYYYGKDYVEQFSALTPNWIILVIVALAIIGGIIGAIIGNKLNKKHFESAGIV